MPACGRPWRTAELDAVDGRRPRARARGPLRRRPHLERGDGAGGRAAALAAGYRHHDVLPVEGSGRAGRLAAVRVACRDRRVRASTGPGSGARCARRASSPPPAIVALETMVERLADDHAHARELADARRGALPGQRRPRRGRDQHRLRAAARPPRRSARPPRGRGRAGGHHRRRHRALRHPQGRRRRRARPRDRRAADRRSRVRADRART